MTTHRVIFVPPEDWTRNNEEHTMSDKKISAYTPPQGVVLLAPSDFDFFYDRIHGVEVIGLTAHDERLGAFAVLFTPEIAAAAGHHLIEMSTTDLQRMRTDYDQLQRDHQ